MRCALPMVAVVLLAVFPAWAEKADRDKPTQIEANRMSADDVKRMTIFEGNVILTKGTIAVRAERIVVRQDAEGFQLTSATGAPVRFKQKQDPKEGEKEGRWMDGEALRVELDERKQTVELFDNARVNRGGDEVAGAYIFVDQRSDFFQVTTGKGGKEQGRVTATLQPNKTGGGGSSKDGKK
ncbi:MAG: lipopolysaccharide transport periplasmic protein LptA [Burkholderiales bacterium]